jgi:hypothetical protein
MLQADIAQEIIYRQQGEAVKSQLFSYQSVR